MPSAEYQRQWRLKNPDKTATYCRTYKEKKPDVVLVAVANWRNNNKEVISKYNSAYRKKNLAKVVTSTRNRRAKYKNSEGFHCQEDIQKIFLDQNGLCNSCKINLTSYDVDHIVPLSKGGSNWPSNLQLLCPSCNRSKNNKTMEEWEQYKNKVNKKNV